MRVVQAVIRSGLSARLPRPLRLPAALGCFLALYAAWHMTGFGLHGHQTFVSNLFFWPVDAAAIGACWAAGRRAVATPRPARAWRLFAFAIAGQLAGDVISTLYQLKGGAPFPSFADLCYLAFYPLVLAGLLSIPQTPRAVSRGRLTLDLAIVTLGGSAALVYVVLGPTTLNDNGGFFPGLVAVAYPIGDILAIGGLALVSLRRPARSARRPLRFVSAALAGFVVADTVYSYQTLHGSYSDGSWLDALWLGAFVAFALAASLQRTTSAADRDLESSAPPARISWLPYVAVALGFGMLLYSDRGDSVFPGMTMTLIAFTLAGLVSVRQLLGQRELLAAQRQLAGSERRYRGLFEQANDMIAIFALDGSLIDLNPAACRRLGYDRDQLGRIPFGSLSPPRLRSVVTTGLEARLPDVPLAGLHETELIAADGQRVPVETSSQPLGPPEAPGGLVVIARDLTERVAHERDLAQAQEQVFEAQKLESIGRLAGGIAHDFNNLLTAIGGYAELGAARVGGGPGSPELAGIAEAARKAAALTAQLLSYSRRQVLDPQTFDLGVAVRELTEMLRRMIPGNVELRLALPAEALGINADRGKMEQVIVNLALNAADALSDTGGTIRFEASATDGHVHLAVADNGSGMDEEAVAHIFEPFFSAKGKQGTGLGLATVHGIIAQSGGEIRVTSQLGEGSCFTISLPRTELPPQALPATAGQAASGPNAAKGRRLLLVDDDEIVRAVTAEMLAERGYRIQTAVDGRQALAIANAAPESIDLLVTDLVMPGLNGRQTAAALRDSQPRMRVLYVSGYTDDTAVRAGGYEPGIAFLQKPYSSEQLAEALQTLTAPA